MSSSSSPPILSATTGGGGGVKQPVVAETSPPTRLAPGVVVHHQDTAPPPPHHHHYPTSNSPRRNLVPTVAVPIIRPVAASSPINSAVRTRSYSLGNVVPVGVGFGTFLNHPVSPPFSSAAARSVVGPHSLMNAADESDGLMLMPPPEPSESCKAMLAAVAKERQRAQEMELAEGKILDAHELRAILKAERKRMAKMAGDLAVLKTAAVQLQLEAEVNEEGRINGLWRQMDTLQQEKGRIIVELEQEEEMLTNTLQKKLNKVRQEKLLLEEKIEREKLANATLQTQLSDLRNSQLAVAEHLEEEDEIEEEY